VPLPDTGSREVSPSDEGIPVLVTLSDTASREASPAEEEIFFVLFYSSKTG
jgi:hypothetical protein